MTETFINFIKGFGTFELLLIICTLLYIGYIYCRVTQPIKSFRIWYAERRHKKRMKKIMATLQREGYSKRDAEEKVVILSIRSSFYALGCDISKFSDEQIKQAVIAFGKMSAVAGVSAKDAAEALKMVCKTTD